MIQELDRQRAAGVQAFSGTITTTGDEPIVVDLALPGFPGEHWIVEQASLRALLTLRGPSTAGGFPPNTGLFLCPPGTVTETLTEAQNGINMAARPLMLPMGAPGANVATVGAGAFPFTFALQLAVGFKITVPYGWSLRAIVSCLQGTATPGPGAGSVGLFTALAIREKDQIEECA